MTPNVTNIVVADIERGDDTVEVPSPIDPRTSEREVTILVAEHTPDSDVLDEVYFIFPKLDILRLKHTSRVTLRLMVHRLLSIPR